MNPYWNIAQKQAQRKPFSWLPMILFGVALALAPFAQSSLLHFLDSPKPIGGIEGLAFRLSALVGAAVALSSYRQIIRTPERDILGLHPIQPQLWFAALFRKTALVSWSWPCIAVALAWPMLTKNFIVEYCLLCAVVLNSWFSMLCTSYAVHLGSVFVARSPAWAPLLDMIRGNNPREQAAFIYAPGFALFFCGITMMLCSFAMEGMLVWYPPALVFFCIPLVLGTVSFFVAQGLSDTQLVCASAILAEVDARWAMLEEGQEEDGVYLEWLAKDRKELLRALRQGWRSMRIWPMSIWGMGLFAFVSGSSGDINNALLFSSIGAIGGCTIGVVMARENPLWLDEMLDVRGKELFWARFWICVLYAQGAILPVLFFVWKNALFRIAMLEACVLLASTISAYLSVYHRKHGVLVYLPIALVIIFVGLL